MISCAAWSFTGRIHVSYLCTVCINWTKQYRFSSPLAFEPPVSNGTECITPQFPPLLRVLKPWDKSNVVVIQVLLELPFVIRSVKRLSLVCCALDVFCSLKDSRILRHQRSAGWIWLLWSPVTRRRRNEGKIASFAFSKLAELKHRKRASVAQTKADVFVTWLNKMCLQIKHKRKQATKSLRFRLEDRKFSQHSAMTFLLQLWNYSLKLTIRNNLLKWRFFIVWYVYILNWKLTSYLGLPVASQIIEESDAASWFVLQIIFSIIS